jgi:lysophospholipase L1-like esterase
MRRCAKTGRIRRQTAARSFYQPMPGRMHPWTQGAADALRIAAIGDSFTVGVGVQKDDNYAARLERLLNCNDGLPPAEVRVHAHAGTSTFQQRALLVEAFSNRPAIAILGICLNDAEDWTHPKRIQRWRDEWMTPTPPAFEAFWLRHSRLVIARRVAHVDAGFRAALRGLLSPPVRSRRGGPGALAQRHRLVPRPMRFEPRGVRAGGVSAAVLRFRAGAVSHAIRAHDAIRDVCREQGVPYLDLLPAFQGDDPVRMQAVPGIDPHPSEIAHRIAAEAILNYLLEQGLVAPGYRPRESGSNAFQHEVWEKTIRRIQCPPGLDGAAPPQKRIPNHEKKTMKTSDRVMETVGRGGKRRKAGLPNRSAAAP